jgi:hypothetical protein
VGNQLDNVTYSTVASAEQTTFEERAHKKERGHK